MSKIRLSHNGNNIVLVGHMGSGKTSIGMNLSTKINYKFIDTDKEEAYPRLKEKKSSDRKSVV